MKKYLVSDGNQEAIITAEGAGTFHIYPKVVEKMPDFNWENITIQEIWQ